MPTAISYPAGRRQAIAVARAVRRGDQDSAARRAARGDGGPGVASDHRPGEGLASSGRVSIIVIDHNLRGTPLRSSATASSCCRAERITVERQVHETSLEELTELMVSSYRANSKPYQKPARKNEQRDPAAGAKCRMNRRRPRKSSPGSVFFRL